MCIGLDWELAERLKCEDAEKKECLELVLVIIGLAVKARREGLLSIEDDTLNLTNSNLRQGIELVVDGTDPECVRNILQIKIIAGNLRGKELLSSLIILEGVLMIQDGTNPRLLKETLFAFFPVHLIQSIDLSEYFEDITYD